MVVATNPKTPVPLDRVPRIIGMGVGHVPLPGPQWMTYTNPDHWALHLYRYDAELRVGTRTHRLRPGAVSLIAPGNTFAYRWPARRSEHVYALFALDGANSFTDGRATPTSSTTKRP